MCYPQICITGRKESALMCFRSQKGNSSPRLSRPEKGRGRLIGPDCTSQVFHVTLSKICCGSPSEGGWAEPSFNFHFKGRVWEQSKPHGVCLKPTCSVPGCIASFPLRATLLRVTLSRLGQDRPAGTGPRGRSKTHATHSRSFHTF